MTEWQPIESAPANERLLVNRDSKINQVCIAKLMDGEWGEPKYWKNDCNGQVYPEPTHWMPLPQPPEKDFHKENLEMLINIYKNQKSVLNDIEIDESIKNTVREISEQHRKIIDDWTKAYLAELYEEGVEIKPGCFTLVEQDASFKSGIYQKKYWFEKSTPRKHHCTFDYADVEIIEQDGVLKMFVDGLTIPVKYCPLCGES